MSELKPKHAEFVRHYLANGCNASAAARSAGYSEKNARQTGSTLLERADVQAEIKRHRDQLEEKTQFDVETAFRDAKEKRDLAVSKGQLMAAYKFTELMNRLHGLLVDRLEIDKKITLDITGAIVRAETVLAEAYPVEPKAIAAPSEEPAARGKSTKVPVDDLF